jgi:hypothetical protein
VEQQMRGLYIGRPEHRGGDMSDYTCRPYRGFGVHVRVHENAALSFNGLEPRFTVTWYLHAGAHFLPQNVIASYSERLAFACPDEAVAYGQRRAHTFVDCAFVVSKE